VRDIIEVCLKFNFFEQLVSSGGQICVIVQNLIKISQMVLEISHFFDFQDGCHLPSWICGANFVKWKLFVLLSL